MKRTLITTLACVACAFSLTAQTQTATLTGTVSHSPSGFALLANDETMDTITINADGSFRFERRLPRPGLYCFMVPRVKIYQSVWMENGKTETLILDADAPAGITMNGDTDRETAFLGVEQDRMTRHKAQEGCSFNQYVKDYLSLADSLQRMADSIGNAEFSMFISNDLAAKVENRKHLYGDLLASWGKRPDSDPDFNAYMERLDLNSAENLQTNKTFYYLKWKARCRPNAPEWDFHAMLRTLSERVTEQKVRDEYSLRLTKMFFTTHDGDTIEAEEVFRLAMRICSPATQTRIKEFYLNTMRPVGSVVQDFEMLAPDGTKTMFGAACDKQLVFVDVWSTWCGPCCKEIPHVAKLVEHYKDDPRVKFVSISLDKNLGNWRKFLASHKPQWEQYVVPEQGQKAFLKEFAINGIPRFMVFSAGRKVVNLNAPTPSSGDLAACLKSLLR